MEAKQDTIFHKIMRQEIPAKILYEDSRIIAFRDINPVASTHVLIVPKEGIPTLNDLREEHDSLVGHMVRVASEIAADEGIAEAGYRLVMNCGEDGNQTVLQLHIHLVGGRRMSWPPG